MTEDEARSWLVERGVSRETMERLSAFAHMVLEEAKRQNLISSSTFGSIWARHVADSAQLLELAPPGKWADLGSGAGFPGIVLSLLGRQVSLIESRAKRVEFLRNVIAELGLTHIAEVLSGKVEALAMRPSFAVISARAFAPLPRLFEVAHHLSDEDTCWLLPKGRSAAQELEAARRTWQGEFRIVPSVTDPEAAIIVARQVRPRKRR